MCILQQALAVTSQTPATSGTDERPTSSVPAIAAAFANVVRCRAIGVPYDKPMSLFDAARPPKLSLLDYAGNLYEDFKCSDECFVLAFVYLDRMLARNQTFRITVLNTHRLLMTSLVLAVKFHDDSFLTNQWYAASAGIDANELMGLEMRLFTMLGSHLKVDMDEYNDYYSRMYQAREHDANTVDVQMVDSTSRPTSSILPVVRDACSSVKPAAICKKIKVHAHSTGLRVSPSQRTSAKWTNRASCAMKRRLCVIRHRKIITTK